MASHGNAGFGRRQSFSIRQRLADTAFAVLGILVLSVGGCAMPDYPRQTSVWYPLPAAHPQVPYPPVEGSPSIQPAPPATNEPVQPVNINPPHISPSEPPDEDVRPTPPTPRTIDFSGAKISPGTPSLFDKAGGTKTSSIWPSFVSYALAAAPPSRTCTQDHAMNDPAVQPATPVADHNTADFLPGLNDVPWGGMVNGTFIALPDMAVLRSRTVAATNTTIELYPNWDAIADKAAAQPAAVLPAVARTYEAETGFVYRLLVRSAASPIACLDILIPYTGFHALTGRIHYYKAGAEYAATFIPSRLK